MNDHAKTTTLASFYDPMLAHIICAKLKANRVPCFIADEYFLWAKPYFNEALGGVKIRVFEKDVKLCNAILAAKDEAPELADIDIEEEQPGAKTCPFCSSLNTRYGGATKVKFHFPSILMLVIFLVPLYFRNAWHCFNCYREFE